jgi:post-segregation antitoxin (ccd killing protein)
MASTRTTFTLDKRLASRAHELGINVSAAARQGVADAVHEALLRADRDAYVKHPEHVDDFWADAEEWGET